MDQNWDHNARRSSGHIPIPDVPMYEHNRRSSGHIPMPDIAVCTRPCSVYINKSLLPLTFNRFRTSKTTLPAHTMHTDIVLVDVQVP